MNIFTVYRHYRRRLAKALKYPEEWDTAAYPTLGDALIEFVECAIIDKQNKPQFPICENCGERHYSGEAC